MRLTRKTLTALAGLLVASGTVAATALAVPTSAATTMQAGGTQQLTGTWSTQVHLADAPPGAPTDFSALDTFLADGGLLVSSSAPNPATRSLAHGAWKQTGHREYKSKFVWFRFDPAGQYAGKQRVTRTMRLSKDHKSFSATDVVTVVAPTGAVVATIHGTEVGRLIAHG